MIPLRTSDLPGLLERLADQTEAVTTLLTDAGHEGATWRPSEAKWSMTGHVAHLSSVNRPYLASMEKALATAESTGAARSDGPWKHPRIASWFVSEMAPPPKRRMKTFKSMVPDPGTDPAAAIADFTEAQRRLSDAIERAEGFDLGRIRFGSPFLPLLRFSLGTAFAMLLAHNDRHIWLMREVNRSRSEG